jgi:hypothetical protein
MEWILVFTISRSTLERPAHPSALRAMGLGQSAFNTAMAWKPLPVELGFDTGLDVSAKASEVTTFWFLSPESSSDTEETESGVLADMPWFV